MSYLSVKRLDASRKLSVEPVLRLFRGFDFSPISVSRLK
jgi:hypothetical protein